MFVISLFGCILCCKALALYLFSTLFGASLSLLSVAPLTAFAQTSGLDFSLHPSSYQWFLCVIVSAGSIIILLLAANSLQKPTSFASLPLYLFFDLTIFVVFFILSMSFFPTDFLEDNTMH
jgi:hypothetical protein